MTASANGGMKYKVTISMEVIDPDELITESRKHAIDLSYFADAASAAVGISTVEEALCWIIPPLDQPGFSILDTNAEETGERAT
jgi:hypothetical protein